MSGMDFCITIYKLLLLFIITHHVNHVNHGFKNINFKTVDFMPAMNEFIFTILNTYQAKKIFKRHHCLTALQFDKEFILLLLNALG